jgi:hypothetical protein
VNKPELNGPTRRVAAAVAVGVVASACGAFAVPVNVTVYGGVAFPAGGMVGADYGHFDWLILDDPGGEHDLVDIRGLTVTGTGAAPCPLAGVRAKASVASWLAAEVCAFRHFTRPNESGPKSPIANPETKITALTAGANFVRPLGPLSAWASAGAGFYFTEISLFASGEGRSGFVYSNVYTLEKSVNTAGWGVYGGGHVAYSLAAGLALDLAARYHHVFNRRTYDIAIHERYGYDPYHYSEYVFATPLRKTYDDQLVEVSLGLAYDLP